MDFDFQWLLLGLPVAFALGWVASRLDLRQLRRENREAPKAYFKGLNLLLNEQQDKAIDAFIEAVQHDPDTAELHFTLGNLFRRRGEFERAVRVHEHLLARGDLKAHDRDRAQYALAQDFMRAGLFDRAEAACRKLEGTAFDVEAKLSLLALYERSRDWQQAIETAEQLERLGQGSFVTRVAHYQCELALAADAQGQSDQAQAALERACQVDPYAARAWLVLGQRKARMGDPLGAMQAWDELRRVKPASFALVASDYAKMAQSAGRASQAREALRTLYQQAPSIALLTSIHALEEASTPQSDPSLPKAEVTADLVRHLKNSATLSAAQALLNRPDFQAHEDALQGIRKAVDRAAKPLQRYHCAACGFEAQQYFWQCPGCLSWDSFPPQTIEEA
jgi:lipopolysaccharide assembly protein B